MAAAVNLPGPKRRSMSAPNFVSPCSEHSLQLYGLHIPLTTALDLTFKKDIALKCLNVPLCVGQALQ